jgi:tetratricopeptide (TPR) repeat protein
MMRKGGPKWVALGVLAVATVLLVMAPRIPASKAGARDKVADMKQARLAEAVALVRGDQPMLGIQQLLKLVEEDPAMYEAHWHLGLFSVQSGQFDKALMRFRTVVDLAGDAFPDAWFYLGRTYATLDSIPQAITCLEHFRTLTDDPELHGIVDRALEELTNEPN